MPLADKAVANGSYSKVVDYPLKQKKRSEHPTLDGSSIIQELGSLEEVVYRFYWIKTSELQAEIDVAESEAEDGWMIMGRVARTPIHEALDLYNAQLAMQRHVSD